MDQNNQQPMNSPIAPMPSMPQAPAPHAHKKVGPIIGTLVIILILVIAALYIFASHVNQQALPTDASTQGASASQASADQQSVQPVTNKADDVQSLQADLNASTNGVDNQNF